LGKRVAAATFSRHPLQLNPTQQLKRLSLGNTDVDSSSVAFVASDCNKPTP